MTDEEKEAIAKWYEQEKTKKLSPPLGSLYGNQRNVWGQTGNITTTGQVTLYPLQIGTAGIGSSPNTTYIPAPPPTRDKRVEYLEERVQELTQQITKAESDRFRAQNMERTAALTVLELRRLEDFLAHSHPEILAEYDTIQAAIKRITT